MNVLLTEDTDMTFPMKTTSNASHRLSYFSSMSCHLKKISNSKINIAVFLTYLIILLVLIINRKVYVSCKIKYDLW